MHSFKITIALPLLLSLCSSSSMHAKPPIQELYAFINYFNDTQYRNCPLRGPVALESSWIKNLSRLGNNQHHTIALLHTLFHVLESGEFNSTNYEPYCHFTFKTIAALLYALWRKKIDEKKGDAFVIIDTLRKTFKGKKNPQSLDKFIKHIIGSQQEIENNLYPSDTLEHILLAFINQKAPKMRELRNLTQVLRKHTMAVDIPSSTVSRTNAWTEDEFQLFFTWCQKASDETIPYDYNFERDFEFLIYAASRWHEMSKHAPAKLLYTTTHYEDIENISDCCESSLRFLCYILLYDAEKKALDLSRLSSTLQSRMSASFMKYFQQTPVATAQEVNDPAARATWYAQASTIPGVRYRRQTSAGKNFEIHPSSNNFLFLLHHIFGIAGYQEIITHDTVQSSWNAWCTALSSESAFDLSCIRVSYQSDITTALTFKLVPKNINSSKQPEILFTLHIQPEHSWIIIDNQVDFNSHIIDMQGERKITNKALLTLKLYQEYSHTQSLKLRDLLHLFAPYLPEEYLKGHGTFDTLIFAHPTENDYQSFRFFKRLLMHAPSPDSPLLMPLIRQANLFYDPCYKQLAWSLLLRKKNLIENTLLQERFNTSVTELPRWEKYHLFLTLLQRKAWQYEVYRTFLLTNLSELPAYEEECGLQVDTYATAFLWCALSHAFSCQPLRSALYETMASMPPQRAITIYNRLRFSPFAHDNDTLALDVKKHLLQLVHRQSSTLP